MTASQISHYKTALDYASQDFDEADPVRLAFVNIVNFLVANAEKNLRHLTFGLLRDVAKLNREDGEILHRTIAYLTGSRANLLTLGYEFIDEDFEYELRGEEVDLFLDSGEFCDPRTGLEVPDSANSIYVFFRPNYAAFH
ncbi:hypothetical protein [Massilia varians]|uniref:hypothetical protein n=1 Tax=Massilia varians TaxID=457921 RepID=UPI0025542FAE|nr:hypothetical protein [Massilia varians]MDK6078658.1 hypothetical protein [Massilia varians]